MSIEDNGDPSPITANGDAVASWRSWTASYGTRATGTMATGTAFAADGCHERGGVDANWYERIGNHHNETFD